MVMVPKLSFYLMSSLNFFTFVNLVLERWCHPKDKVWPPLTSLTKGRRTINKSIHLKIENTTKNNLIKSINRLVRIIYAKKPASTEFPITRLVNPPRTSTKPQLNQNLLLLIYRIASSLSGLME